MVPDVLVLAAAWLITLAAVVLFVRQLRRSSGAVEMAFDTCDPAEIGGDGVRLIEADAA